MADQTKQDAVPPEGSAGDQSPPPDKPQAPPPDDVPITKQIDEMSAKIAALEAEREEARKAAEQAKEEAERASLSAEERAKRELEAHQTELQAEREKLRADRLRMELDRRGVTERARKFVPDVDPSTDEGRAALDNFAREYPEFIAQRGDVRPPPVEPDEATAKRLGTSLQGLKAAMDNFRAIGKSDEWIQKHLGGR
jgi:HD-GYP domain-containing protein (c-di-GMP phosphodiesterase class II)